MKIKNVGRRNIPKALKDKIAQDFGYADFDQAEYFAPEAILESICTRIKQEFTKVKPRKLYSK